MTEGAGSEVGIRELKARLSDIVGGVQFRGDVIHVTKHDKRVAVLVPVEYFERAEAALKLARESAES
jgi:prevent-host-death family protein